MEIYTTLNCVKSYQSYSAIMDDASKKQSANKTVEEVQFTKRNVDLNNAVRDLACIFSQKAERRRDIVSRLEKAAEMCEKFLNESYCISCFVEQLIKHGFRNFLFCIKQHFPEDICNKLRLMESDDGGYISTKFHSL